MRAAGGSGGGIKSLPLLGGISGRELRPANFEAPPLKSARFIEEFGRGLLAFLKRKRQQVSIWSAAFDLARALGISRSIQP
jgi:hypothetical protein